MPQRHPTPSHRWQGSNASHCVGSCRSRSTRTRTPGGLTSTHGTCPICRELKNELGVIGGRKGCGHRICRRCISEWMAHENSCPICRVRFNKVVFPISPNLRIHEDNTQAVAEGYLEMMNDVEEYDSEEDRREKEELQHDIAQCMYCKESDNEAKLLLCDNRQCFKAAHTYCLKPPLRRVPRGEWFCPQCEEQALYTLTEPMEFSDSEKEEDYYDPPALNTRFRFERALPDRESVWSGQSETTASLLYSVYSD